MYWNDGEPRPHRGGQGLPQRALRRQGPLQAREQAQALLQGMENTYTMFSMKSKVSSMTHFVYWCFIQFMNHKVNNDNVYRFIVCLVFWCQWRSYDYTLLTLFMVMMYVCTFVHRICLILFIPVFSFVPNRYVFFYLLAEMLQFSLNN